MKYFSKYISEEMYTPFTFSTEMIDPQPHDEDIKKIEDIYRNLGVRDNMSQPLKSVNRQDVISANKEISKIIKKRFGMNIKLIEDTNGGCFTCPINLNVVSIFDDFSIWAKEIEQEASESKDKTDNVELLRSSNDYNKIYSFYFKNMVNALRDKKLLDVEVDISKARILNLPDYYKGFIAIDTIYFIGKGFTTKGLVSLLLHEIGHNFNNLENSYRWITNTTVLLDTLRTEVDVRGKNNRTAVKLAYEKIFKEKVPDNITLEEILLSWSEQGYAQGSLSNSAQSVTDCEQLADQFASRFGYGYNIVEELNLFKEELAHSMGNTLVLMQRTLVATSFSSILFMISLPFTSVFLGTFVIFILGLIFIPSVQRGGTEDGGGTTYDHIYKRFQRIKLDMIRQLRTIPNIDNDYKARLLQDIEQLDKILTTTPRPQDVFLGRMLRFISSDYRRVFDMKRSHQLLEDLAENELHIASTKLQKFR